MMSVSSIVKDKAMTLEDLKDRWETLTDRIEEIRNKEAISLPEFEAYGWSRLEEFLKRLEDAINTPLLEEARNILAAAKLGMTQQILDRLKTGLSVRRRELIEILNATATELKGIGVERVLNRCRVDLTKYLEEGRWDDLVTRSSEWKSLGKDLEPLRKEMNDATHFYSAIFERALSEGPSTGLIEKLAEIEKRAFEIGGQMLKDCLRYEEIENPLNPFGRVDSNLTKLAEKKEDIRQLQGEEINVEELTEEKVSLQTLLKMLDAKYNEAKDALNSEQQKAEALIRKYNDLAGLLEKPNRILPDSLNLKQLKQFTAQLESDMESLGKELVKSFSSDAKVFIENLSEGKLPEKWSPRRVVNVLRELLDKKLRLRLKGESEA